MSDNPVTPPRRLVAAAILLAGAAALLTCAFVAMNRDAAGVMRTVIHNSIARIAPDMANRMILHGVRMRAEAADALITATLSLPPMESIDRLRHLLRYHVTDDPPFEGDDGWAVRIRALRAIGASPLDVQPTAIPELLEVMARDCGTAALESREILLGMECLATPATPLLLGILDAGDDYRAELAVSVLSHLAVECGDGFTGRDSAVQKMIRLVENPNRSTSFRCRLLTELWIFDRTGARSGDLLRDLADSTSVPEDVRDHARAAIVQMGLDR
ncbi:MAG: hypothetical protein DWH79_13200 [Planctomycetota bacterium]|nr:MAG: hypothetical protein DWH79_13200 [Planctomycetota bacterium]